jgi:hypothetical protein
MAENTSLAFEVRHLPANNCLKTPAYANATRILGYPRPANTPSHFVTLAGPRKQLPKRYSNGTLTKNATISMNKQ